MTLDLKKRAKSIIYATIAGRFKKFEKKFFLNAPGNLPRQRRNSVTSNNSMDSNIFKRGVESISNNGRRASLFDVIFHSFIDLE
jgi:hypothetical protein